MDAEISLNCQNSAPSEAKARIVQAVLELWEELPGSELSARKIALKAGVALSAIDYHFGKLGHLYVASQSQALSQADLWAEARATELTAFAEKELGAAAIAAILASTIDDWTEGQRPLAMAWREAGAAARRGDDLASHAQWIAFWTRFWQRAADALGIPALADLLMAFFIGEASQHLLRWTRLLDRALLDETVRAFADRVCGEVGRTAPIRAAYSALAEQAYLDTSEPESPLATPLETAAADILRESGASALTFRAVAARANTTLGYASYHFESKTRMLRIAFQRLYDAQWGESRDTLVAGQIDDLADLVADAIAGGQEPVLRAMDAINLHISRSVDHHAMRGLIRAYPDPAATWVLQSLLRSEQPVPSSLAAAFSSICRGLDQLALAHGTVSSRSDCRRILAQFSEH